jgi:hypothetical protein
MSRKRFTIWFGAFIAAFEGILPLLPGAHTAFGQAQFKTTTQLVLTPVRVTDSAGKTVDGLKAEDFELFENGKLRKFELESTFEPVSLVVAVQTSGISGPALAKIRKIGSLIQPLIVGDQGAGAVLTFSEQVRMRQDFSDDPVKIGAAFRGIEPDGSGAAMHDAIAEGVRLLAARENRRRRVLIVIGEARDRSSRLQLDEVISRAQAANARDLSGELSGNLDVLYLQGRREIRFRKDGVPARRRFGFAGGVPRDRTDREPERASGACGVHGRAAVVVREIERVGGGAAADGRGSARAVPAVFPGVADGGCARLPADPGACEDLPGLHSS